MKTKIRAGVVLAGVLAFAGCISVESTKLQLDSGNPQLIAEAEKNIYMIGSSEQYPSQSRLEYINLTSNQDLLVKLFSKTYYDDEVGVAVAKKLEFSKKGAIVAFLKQYGAQFDKSDDKVKGEVIEAMLSTATQDELTDAARYLSSQGPEFLYLQGPLMMKVAQGATDQELMYELVNGTVGGCVRSGDGGSARGNGRGGARGNGSNGSHWDVALKKLTDQKKLMTLYCDYNCYARDKVLEKLECATICEFVQNDPRYKDVAGWRDDKSSALVARIKDEKDLAKILMAKEESSGASRLLDLIKNESIFAAIAIGAKNAEIKELAAKKVKDYAVISKALVNEKMADEKIQLVLVNGIQDGAADIKLYDDLKNPTVKKAVLAKLSNEGRIQIRSRSKAECEKLIADAKGKGAETFELAGFYLGMNIEDAEKLIGYHFPDFLTEEEKYDDGGCALHVSYQRSEFCHADKEGKVYRLNFGKKMLKKWYKFDVQTPMEWAHAYGRETKADMRYKMIDVDKTIYDLDMSNGNRVWFHQESYQFKHNTKEYRLTYFGEEKDYTVEGGIVGELIKSAAEKYFRYIRGDVGSLRAQIERE